MGFVLGEASGWPPSPLRTLSPRPLCVPGSESVAGVALSRHHTGCAGGGPSPRPLCVPGSENLAGVRASAGN
eukprot:4597330-Pyramimonas_sp.AAC.1